MKPSLTDTLCTRCGLCCDGSLFADVELASTNEAAALEVMGLEIEDGEDTEGDLLLQPCRALKGKRCSIYAHRPECCRTFECRLLQEVKRGEVTVERAKEIISEALKRIKSVKQLLVRLGDSNDGLPLKEWCAETLEFSVETASDPALNQHRAELQTAMTSLETLLRETFLTQASFRPVRAGR